MISALKKNKEIVMYLIFGVLTTVVNIVVYYLCNDVMHMHYLIANAIAWLVSVLFAYVTNRKYVFESCDASWIAECLKFMTSRVSTGVIDMIVMFVLVNLFAFSSMISKVLSNVLVIVLNYLFSKLFVFKKVNEDGND